MTCQDALMLYLWGGAALGCLCMLVFCGLIAALVLYLPRTRKP